MSPKGNSCCEMMGTRKENANLIFYALLDTEEEEKNHTILVLVKHCIDMLRILDNAGKFMFLQ